MQTLLPILNNNSFAQILNDFTGLDIAIFGSSRLKKTWRLEKKVGKYSLIIPNSFAYVPDEIKKALLCWAQIIIEQKFNRRNANITAKKQIKKLEDKIYAFIKDEFGFDEKRIIIAPQKKFRYTDGKKFDLTDIFNKLNNEYFDGALKCFFRWGKVGSRTSYHTICRDERGVPFHLITIAGLYNLHSVPDFAIESVMYHEMLHIAYPPEISGIRRNVHHKQFREKERQFPHYEEWKNWQGKDERRC
jgi:hypothetical protein